MSQILNIRLNLIVFITLFMPAVWTIYVPEHVNSQLIIDTLEMKPEKYNTYNKHTINDDKPLQPEQHEQQQQQSGNTYLLNLNDGHESLSNARQAKTTQLLHHTSYDTNDDVVNDYNSSSSSNSNNNTTSTNNNYENLEAQPTSLLEEQKQQQHDDDEIDEMSALTNDDDSHSHSHSHSRQRRSLKDFLIAPNTRWCGRGNTANGTYNHLGGATMADKCCRTHDHCKVYIPAMSNRFDLFNYRPYTLSHCTCDRRFRTCLKMADDEDANTIGKLFFNLVPSQCFILVKEKVCAQRAADGSCDKENVKQKAYLRNNKKF